MGSGPIPSHRRQVDHPCLRGTVQSGPSKSSDKNEKKAHQPATLATPIVPVPDVTEGVWWPRNLNGSFVSWEQLAGDGGDLTVGQRFNARLLSTHCRRACSSTRETSYLRPGAGLRPWQWSTPTFTVDSVSRPPICSSSVPSYG
jgi:hypothetical protein